MVEHWSPKPGVGRSSRSSRAKQQGKYLLNMKKIVDYFKDVYNELVNKTSWPTWRDLSNSAIVVMIASVIIACMVFVMDFTFEHVLKLVYGVMYH